MSLNLRCLAHLMESELSSEDKDKFEREIEYR